MAKINNIKRIIAEDFPKEDRVLIEKLSYVLNNFMSEVVNAFDKNINFSNLNQEIISIVAQVDQNGNPINSISFQTSVSNIQGLIVINALGSNSSTLVTSSPFITYSPTSTSKVYSISNIKGLVANSKYTLKVLIIGN